MIRTDEDSLICDMAEYYRIYDYKSQPMLYVATLFLGLGRNSRCKLKLSRLKYPVETILMARIVDGMTALLYKGSKKRIPESALVLQTILEEDKKQEHMVFDSPEAFERYMSNKRKRMSNGN